MLLVEMIRPNECGLRTRPEIGSMLPPEEAIPLKSLRGLARFTLVEQVEGLRAKTQALGFRQWEKPGNGKVDVGLPGPLEHEPRRTQGGRLRDAD